MNVSDRKLLSIFVMYNTIYRGVSLESPAFTAREKKSAALALF